MNDAAVIDNNNSFAEALNILEVVTREDGGDFFLGDEMAEKITNTVLGDNIQS